MKQVRNAAVAGAGVFVGEMISGWVVGMIPASADGTVNPFVERVVRYGVTGLVVVWALKTLGTRKG